MCPLCNSRDSRPDFEGPDLEHGGDEVFTYLECTTCHAVFQDPMPDEERLGDFYPDDYVPFQPPRVKPARALERAVLRFRYGYRHLEAPLLARALAPVVAPFRYRTAVPFQEGGRLLDVGCGNGKFLLSMQALGFTVTGIDRDERAVKACRDAGLDVRLGALTDDDLPVAGFDLVSARHVIEHLRDPSAFVRSAARVLRPGGGFHVRTPNTMALGRRRFGAAWYANQVPRHIVMFCPLNLEALLTSHGFLKAGLRTRSTPKILLNSKDLRRGDPALPSRHIRWARLLARPYVWASMLLGRGDELFAHFTHSQSAESSAPDIP